MPGYQDVCLTFQLSQLIVSNQKPTVPDYPSNANRRRSIDQAAARESVCKCVYMPTDLLEKTSSRTFLLYITLRNSLKRRFAHAQHAVQNDFGARLFHPSLWHPSIRASIYCLSIASTSPHIARVPTIRPVWS